MTEKTRARGTTEQENRHHGLTVEDGTHSSKANDPKEKKTRELLREAVSWRDLNPRVWAGWVAAAITHAMAGQRFSMQQLIEETRAAWNVDEEGNDVLINNTLAPIFARMLAQEEPLTRPYIELRKSRFDKYFCIPLAGGANG